MDANNAHVSGGAAERELAGYGDIPMLVISKTRLHPSRLSVRQLHGLKYQDTVWRSRNSLRHEMGGRGGQMALALLTAFGEFRIVKSVFY